MLNRLLSLFLGLALIGLPFTAIAEEATVPFSLVKSEQLDSSWKNFRDKLIRDYSGLLERDKRALDGDLDEVVIDLTTKKIAEVVELGPFGIFQHLFLPLFVCALLFLILLLLDKAFLRYVWRKQAGIDLHGIDWVNNLLRSAIVLAGRLIPISIVAGLCIFPIQPIFDSAPWTLALTSLMVPWIVFRFLHGAVSTVFGFRLVVVSDEAALKLKQSLLWMFRVGFTGIAAQRVVLALELPQPLSDWLIFITFLSVACAFASFAFLRREVVELFGGSLNSAVAERIRHRAHRYFFPVFGATILLFILAAFGFGRASSFILYRAYGAIFVISAALRVGAWLHTIVQARVALAESRDEKELFGSIGTMLRFAGLLAFSVIGLKLLMLWEPLMALMSIELFRLGKVGLELIDLLDASVVIGIAILAGKVVRAVLLAAVFPKLGLDVGVSYAINALLSYAFFVAGLLAALIVLGVDFSSLTVVIAALGVGIGLGLQSLTENLVSGFILLFGRSVKKGDVITVNNLYGRVEEVGARSVVIRTPDNVDMLIPSKNLVNGEVVNWSYRDPLIRVHVPVGVTYRCNPRQVEELLKKAAASHPKVLKEPAPEVWLTGFGDSAVNFELLVFIDLRDVTQRRMIGQLNFIIWDLLHEAKIEIPFPQRDLHLKPGEALSQIVDALKDSTKSNPKDS